MAEVQNIVRDRLGIELTPAQAEFLFQEAGSSALHELRQKESICDVLAVKIAGMKVPCIRDSQPMKDEFWTKLEENSPKLGYSLSED